MVEILVSWFLVCIACCIFGVIIGGAKGQPVLGFFVAFVLGPFGVLIACLLPEKQQRGGRFTPDWRERRAQVHRDQDAESWLDEIGRRRN